MSADVGPGLLCLDRQELGEQGELCPQQLRPQSLRPQSLRPHSMRPQFRLRPGQDDTLIHWLNSFTPRQRSTAIRQALSEYLSGRGSRVAVPHGSEDPDLAQALDALF